MLALARSVGIAAEEIALEKEENEVAAKKVEERTVFELARMIANPKGLRPDRSEMSL